MRIVWSSSALDDLDRFASFLHRHHPDLAAKVGRELAEKSQVLSEQPLIGRAIDGTGVYRELLLRVLNATYAFQYRIEGEMIVMLRVFHGREKREAGLGIDS